ncbi:hypothetical protein SAFG77S_05855 [Streptomyces afghaniensis]
MALNAQPGLVAVEAAVGCGALKELIHHVGDVHAVGTKDLADALFFSRLLPHGHLSPDLWHILDA